MRKHTFAISTALFAVTLTAGAATVPDVAYVQGGDRTLIYCNNPEQLILDDLGDVRQGEASILVVAAATAGDYRAWFEHTNRTGKTIGYAVNVTNPGAAPVTVTIHGEGYTADLPGGKPFAEMLENYSTTGTDFTVDPGETFWVFQRDEQAPANAFFSGVVDFDVTGGSVDVEFVAYDRFSKLAASRTYLGYVQRIEPDSTHEARTYKGVSAFSEAIADNVDFTIDDADLGVLDVRHPNYDLALGGFGTPQVRSGWFSNVGPAQNPDAVTGDMVSWDMPGWGIVDPLVPSDGTGDYPNLGNWAVMYTVKGTVTNVGNFGRDLSVNLQAPPNGGSPIAYRGNDGVWRELEINAGSNVRYFTFSVPAGSSAAYEAKYILGGPGAGSLHQTIAIDNEVPTSCATDPECDDGLFCNGAEVCNAGTCEAGSTPCSGAEVCDEAGDVCTPCGNGTCESGEDCNSCPADCPSLPLPGSAVCGNGLCEAGDGEDCVSCPADCDGVQSGKPSGRFCCGFGGENPVGCGDAACTTGGFSCTEVPMGADSCCGDLVCEGSEDSTNCSLDCGTGPVTVDVTTLSYGADGAQVLDLHTPTNLPASPMPTVVLAHGGLWQSGDKSALTTLCDNVVVGSGGTIACATVNYRLSQDLGGVCTGPGLDTYRDQVTDLASAFVLLQNESDVRGLDAARMYVGGHSAGGHLSHEFNLRWSDFEQTCTHPSGCPPALGAIGFEGIYDIAAWDAYDASFWNGQFFCATRKAFGFPASSPPSCTDAQFGLPCWDVGSPRYLADNSVTLGITPVGHALVIHSPGDNWVDVAEATNFGAALSAAFPGINVITTTDGTCATGQHNDPLTQTALATCIVNFVASGGSGI